VMHEVRMTLDGPASVAQMAVGAERHVERLPTANRRP